MKKLFNNLLDNFFKHVSPLSDKGFAIFVLLLLALQIFDIIKQDEFYPIISLWVLIDIRRIVIDSLYSKKDKLGEK